MILRINLVYLPHSKGGKAVALKMLNAVHLYFYVSGSCIPGK
jgi:hypothetical protein